jgi:hypothetical protein
MLKSQKIALLVASIALLFPSRDAAETVPVRHIEGVTFGFLVLRTVDGKAIAYGNLKQVSKGNLVTDELLFHFKDGSLYDQITKFTQKGEFRLVSDQVVQKGPAFKQDSESWIDAENGKITVRTYKDGKPKETSQHLDVPADAANGLLFTLAKNIDPSRETVMPMVAASEKPRIVKLHISPAEGKVIKQGTITLNTQHFVVKTKIEGAAGVIAPLLGKQPPDAHIWIVKSEAPTFVEFEGPLSQDTPVWRIELMTPEPDPPNAKTN